jgi:hypothetical protein
MIKRIERCKVLRGFSAVVVIIIICCAMITDARSDEATLRGTEQRKTASSANPPNVLIFIVDDLGWNQVGYHAAPAGNHEIQTPHIDAAAAAGVELNRGYMTPWCVPRTYNNDLVFRNVSRFVLVALHPMR